MNDKLSAALLYASMGWHVVPISNRGNKKIPLIKQWETKATTNPAIIDSWWNAWSEANVGIATGKISGLVVIDIDAKRNGEDALRDLQDQYGKLPGTVESVTGGGGRHLLYRYPAQYSIRNSASKLGIGLDIRGDGGQIVAPPSVHASGIAYMWEASSNPEDTSLAELPEWVCKLIADAPAATGQPNRAAAPQAGQAVTAGKRNTTLAALAGVMRRRAMSPDAIEAALLAENRVRCVPPLGDDEVRVIAHSVSRYNSQSVPTDDELAEKWLQNNPGTAYGLGEFRKYKDGVWPVIPTNQIEGELLQIMEDAKRNGFKPSAFKLKSIMELSRIKCQVDDDRWNNNPDIVVCANGVLHIPTKTIQGHNPDHYQTSAVAYDYDPGAHADTWEYFLYTTVPDAVPFLQEFAGYALTIITQYELAVWLYGPAGSGKSTFICGMEAALGNRAGILGLADIERSRFALSDLPDKTLLVSTEQPSLYISSSWILNALISGELVTIDRKFKDPITLRSRAKILWAMNELPRLGEAENGLFRRVKVVEFPPLPEASRDPRIKEKILTEGSGILNWALDGLHRLRVQGKFEIPQCVATATDEFKRGNDVPSIFVEDCCVVDAQGSIKAQVLYEHYRQWCIDNGHRTQSSTSLAQDWKRMGFQMKHTMYGNFYQGLRLKP